ncbi:MAG: DUF5615 family PIN-like protein [Chloroflexi bacterium]|nr:DUF5615 family PIN-like protein [Chloroflexota bacterium]
MPAERRSSTVRLHFDEDADARLAEALRQQGYDVKTTLEVGLQGAADLTQLAYAAGQQRALVTHNVRHFVGQHAAWLEGGREHWGIIVLIGYPHVGLWLRRMENLLTLFSADELRNQLVFLGAEYDA